MEENGGSRHLSDILRRIYDRDIVASAGMLEQSLSNLGDTARIRRVVRKLVKGIAVL